MSKVFGTLNFLPDLLPFANSGNMFALNANTIFLISSASNLLFGIILKSYWKLLLSIPLNASSILSVCTTPVDISKASLEPAMPGIAPTVASKPFRIVSLTAGPILSNAPLTTSLPDFPAMIFA